MPRNIFISYRRDDSRYQARMVYTAFTQVVPRDSVFMDIDAIPPGANFRKILKDWVDQCEILLALIGPGWIDAADPTTGRRRLDNPSDFVRIEIAEALAREIPVVPMLLDGTPMPKIDQLPADLKELVDRQAEIVEYRTFDTDVARLIQKLRLGPSAEDRRSADGRIKIDAPIIHGAANGWFLPGNGKTEWFKDHENGPEMVVVPAGSFTMGSTANEPERFDREAEVRVWIAAPIAVSKYTVTFDEWDACVTDGGCNGYKPDDVGWGRTKHPVVDVNWDDAKAYAAWLSYKTAKTYRLLSESEWEYVARAGTTTPFWWGSSITPLQANYDGSADPYKGGGSKGEDRKRTVPVDSFEPNPWGIYNVHGNVWEWTGDCWNESNSGNPRDGSSRTTGDCDRRVVRGGSWASEPPVLRAAYRAALYVDTRLGESGFRLARTLSP
jgi:formylglycine-generating enzyme required for sulfatase activity